METLGLFTIALIGSLICSFLKAVVIQKGWLWFLVPLGLPLIGYWHAFALGVFIKLLTTKVDTEKPQENKFDLKYVLRGLLTPAITYVIVWGILAILSLGV